MQGGIRSSDVTVDIVTMKPAIERVLFFVGN